MCGICGFVGTGVKDSRKLIDSMCTEIRHRGPDDCGMKFGDGWGLGHVRLRIIDLSDRARQPFANESGTRFFACNGEMYNFLEVRAALVERGHVFVSESDSEVMMHALEEYGQDALAKFRGMFAFAYVDLAKRELLLCRDRFGIKPIYYNANPSLIVFASEVKALFKHPDVKVELNRSRICEHLQYGNLWGDETLFGGIKEILPGQILTVNLDSAAVETRQYWEPRRRREGTSCADAEIEDTLVRSVRSYLVSDVPLGTQLSGGLDSTLITAMAAREKRHGMHTFSVGFPGSALDESRWSKMASLKLGTIHHHIEYASRGFVSDLVHCAWLNDTPLVHANGVPMYALCREARKYVTVMLTGEGADEIFAGYHWHARLRRLSLLGRLAHVRATRPIAVSIRGGRIANIARLIGLPPWKASYIAGEWIHESHLKRILPPELMKEALSQTRGEAYRDSGNALLACLDIDTRTYLRGVLQRQDRMSMASGVESRVPFLDEDVVDRAVLLSPGQLFEGRIGKQPLRRIGRGLIPDEIINRAKVGFAVPISLWMREGGAVSGLLEWLYSDRAAERGIWFVDEVKRLVRAHRTGHADHANVLWALLSLELWARIWLDGMTRDEVQQRAVAEVGGKGPDWELGR